MAGVGGLGFELRAAFPCLVLHLPIIRDVMHRALDLCQYRPNDTNNSVLPTTLQPIDNVGELAF